MCEMKGKINKINKTRELNRINSLLSVVTVCANCLMIIKSAYYLHIDVCVLWDFS